MRLVIKKYIYTLIIIFTLVMYLGCSKIEETNISFFSIDTNTLEKKSNKPILKITNENDIKLFEDMLNTSNKINGMVNVVSPQFIVEIKNKSNKKELIFVIYENSGMYSNTKDTHTWYKVDEKYLSEFNDLHKDKLKNR